MVLPGMGQPRGFEPGCGVTGRRSETGAPKVTLRSAARTISRLEESRTDSHVALQCVTCLCLTADYRVDRVVNSYGRA